MGGKIYWIKVWNKINKIITLKNRIKVKEKLISLKNRCEGWFKILRFIIRKKWWW
jgi:hypothetical protein